MRRRVDQPPKKSGHAINAAKTPSGRPNCEQVLGLQRLAGNRAVASALITNPASHARPVPISANHRNLLALRHGVGHACLDPLVGVLQRQVTTAEVVIGVELSPAQLAKARRFYAANRRRYTDSLIRDIQTAVGQPPTGVIGDATIIAVANKQDDFGPPLVPDGMAGGRTLARLFPSGLARQDTADRFIASVKDVVSPGEWARLTTAQSRAERLLDLAAVQLASAEIGVAPDAVAVSGQDVVAVTRHEGWTVHLDIEQNLLERPSITDGEARRVAVTVYHEARHLEQYHKMARMLAAKGLSASAITRKMKIPARVAHDAHDNPLRVGTPEFITAEDQFEGTFGPGKARHDQAEAEAVQAERALAAAKRSGDPSAIAKAEARREAARVKHDRLTTETDAVGTENTIFESW